MSGQIFGRRVALVEEVLTCAHAPQEYHKMSVERTTGVSKPLTCYRCQQGFTPSSKVGNIHHYYIIFVIHSHKHINK